MILAGSKVAQICSIESSHWFNVSEATTAQMLHITLVPVACLSLSPLQREEWDLGAQENTLRFLTNNLSVIEAFGDSYIEMIFVMFFSGFER